MDCRQQIQESGYAILPHVVAAETLDALTTLLESTQSSDTSIRRRTESSTPYAIRNVLNIPEIAALARGPVLMELAQQVLGPKAFAVRGIFFDKTPDANWHTGWHQDRSIPVQEEKAVPGFSGWSRKAGVLHADAPATVMDAMLAIRVHLDDCGSNNAPLQVLPGSHRFGYLDSEADELRGTEPATLLVQRGDVILMKPLLLHSSLPAEQPLHRRVIHLEYAASDLPGGLVWGCA